MPVKVARFASPCKRCNGQIAVGAPIIWGQAESSYVHEVCGARQPAAPRQTLLLPNIREFIQRATDSGLKRPKLRFLGPDGKSELRVSLADLQQFAGNIRVKLGGEFVGRIAPDGNVFGHRLSARPDLLRELAAAEADPVAAAKRYGAIMQHCTFCGLPLTDAGSVEMGYGPICAANYSLPWIGLGVPEVRTVPPGEKPRVRLNAEGEVVR
jgi:hypothetical protein